MRAEDYFVSAKKPAALFIISVIVSVFMFSLDFSMFNISLPSIAKYFHAKLWQVADLPVVYILIVTSSLLGFGKLGDIRGYKRVFIAGIIFFIAGMLLAGVSPNIKVLFTARMIEALGEAMFTPAGIAMLTTFLPVSKRGIALGFLALAQGLGFTAGNALGSLITTYISWRAIFLVNLPIAGLNIYLATRFIPTRQPEVMDKRFDFKGSALIFIALGTFLYALNTLQKLNSPNPALPWLLGISVVAFGAFVIQEKRIKYPILDFSLFKNRDFAFANLSVFFVMAMLMAMIFLAPFYFQMAKGYSLTKAGLLLSIPSLTMMLVAPLSGRISDLCGSRLICSIGAFLEMVAFIMFVFITLNPGFLLIVCALLTLGLSAGAFLAPNNRLVMLQAPFDKQGVASGVYKISVSTGSVMGIALAPVIIIRTANSLVGKMHFALAELKDVPPALEASFRAAFIFGVAVCALAFIFALLAKDKQAAQES